MNCIISMHYPAMGGLSYQEVAFTSSPLRRPAGYWGTECFEWIQMGSVKRLIALSLASNAQVIRIGRAGYG
jgi:hypothetical protein